MSQNAFGLLDPQAKDFFLAGRIEGKRHIHGLVLDDALVADFDPQSIEENDRIDRIERPVLPVPDFFEDGIGDPADQIWRDIDAVELGQMALDLANRHAAGVEAQNLIVEPVEPGLAFRDQLRLKAPRPVARNRNSNLALLRQKRLRTCPIAAVAASPAGRVALLVAQMLRQLGAECPLDQRFLQLLEKPVFAGQILRLGIVGKKLIEQLCRYRRPCGHVKFPLQG